MRKYLQNVATAALAVVRIVLPDVLWLVGLGAIAYGIGLYSVPAGVIAGGLGACFLGFIVGRAGDVGSDGE